MANNVVGALEKIAKALDEEKELPVPKTTDAGKILGVDSEGKWALIDAPAASQGES